MFSLLGLLQCIPGPISCELVFIAGSLIYYVRCQSLKVYAIVAAQIVPMLILLNQIGDQKLWICLSIFIVAWIGQFIGHKIEGKKPSFTADIQFLWIGPLWIFS